ncbi:sulfite exporter TauE/SafE family protein [Syntrophomonas erecta]
MISYIVMVAVGIAAGVLGAILGVGGGVVMLPATEYILGLTTTLAIGTTLFSIMFTSISGAYGHYKEGNVHITSAMLIGAGGLVGVLLGSYVFKQYLSSHTKMLEFLLGLLFLFMAIRMAREFWKERGQAELDTDYIQEGKRLPLWTLTLVGLLTGSLTGMLGLGGGFIMVPAMIWLFAAAPYQAVGTTLLAMFPISAVGAFIKLFQGYVDLQVALLMGVGTIIGAQLGVLVTRYISRLVFKFIFALLFTYLSFNYLSHLIS